MSSDPTVSSVVLTLGFRLPLLRDGSYCEVYKLPALAAVQTGLPLSTNRVVKILRLNNDGGPIGFSHVLAFLSNIRAATPEAFEHRHITSFDILDATQVTPLGPQPTLALVTPFYCQGDILNYGNRCSPARKLSLLIQIAQALEHLHHYDVVHGHIYPGNIYVTDTGNATVTDALVYTLASQYILHPHATIPLQNSFIYQARERLWPGTYVFIPPAKTSDVYAFASVIYAVVTGNPPFQGSPHRTLERSVAEILFHGHLRVPRPGADIMGDNLWDLVQRCWALGAAARPTMDEVVTTLEDIELYD
ncbi:hypothetical protein Hypma_007303 [Hypsizygus marmoreus]|uniref:Protein kinase domain-containing protein n=1 Tax=Hypsizygus marmoreus TaxID=39966 RepID=A0A369KBK8_HYPMA|nr:hypothetical protein Hypma_007303 [Hypsizygus marmoreus]